jgi:hypothetical protein
MELEFASSAPAGSREWGIVVFLGGPRRAADPAKDRSCNEVGGVCPNHVHVGNGLPLVSGPANGVTTNPTT